MHRVNRLVLALVFAGTAANAAYAADLVVADPVAPAYNWNGLYVGAGIGAGAVNHAIDILGIDILDGIGGEGVFGQLTVGYDQMISDRILLGAFADYRFGNIATDIAINAAPVIAGSYELSLNHGYDLGARLGLLLSPETLAYVTGGYSHQSFAGSGFGFDYDWDTDGYFYGAGLETVLSGNWTVKGEYRFSQYDRNDILGLIGVEPSTHTFLAGLNYRMGGGGAPSQSSFAPINHNFAGLKVGVAGGFGAVVHQFDLAIPGVPLTALLDGIGGEGMFGEVNVGYDFNIAPQWIAGIGANYRHGDIRTEIVGDLFTITADKGFDVYARIGYQLRQDTLVYGLAGYSHQDFSLGTSIAPLAGIVDSLDWSADGWTAGGGIETALSDRWTAKIEYRYAEYDATNPLTVFGVPPAVASLDISPSTHTVRAGLSFKVY